MFRMQIKDLRAIASEIALDDKNNLIFARLIVRSSEEVRGWRLAINSGKVFDSDVGFLKAQRVATQVWVDPRIYRGVTSWIITAYTPELDGVLHYIKNSDDPRKFGAFLHQYTPYPIPPLSGVGEQVLKQILDPYSKAVNVFGAPAVGERVCPVYSFALEQIKKILEEISS